MDVFFYYNNKYNNKEKKKKKKRNNKYDVVLGVLGLVKKGLKKYMQATSTPGNYKGSLSLECMSAHIFVQSNDSTVNQGPNSTLCP